LTSDNPLSQKVRFCTDTEVVIHKLNSAITAVCDATFHVSRPGKRATKERSVPWLTTDLRILRKKKALALRRRYQRTKIMLTCGMREECCTSNVIDSIRLNFAKRN